MATQANLVHKLNRVGLKATQPRLCVLRVFDSDPQRHLSIEDIHRQVIAVRAGVSFSTIYRIVGQLTAIGILSRTTILSRRVLYELHPVAEHGHLVCLECGRIDDFQDEGIKRRLSELATGRGYAIARRRVEFYGTCPECREKWPKHAQTLRHRPAK